MLVRALPLTLLAKQTSSRGDRILGCADSIGTWRCYAVFRTRQHLARASKARASQAASKLLRDRSSANRQFQALVLNQFLLRSQPESAHLMRRRLGADCFFR